MNFWSKLNGVEGAEETLAQSFKRRGWREGGSRGGGGQPPPPPAPSGAELLKGALSIGGVSMCGCGCIAGVNVALGRGDGRGGCGCMGVRMGLGLGGGRVGGGRMRALGTVVDANMGTGASPMTNLA